MALLFMDGFDHCGPGFASYPLAFGKWVDMGTVYLDSGIVRTGTAAVHLYYSNSYLASKQFAPTGGFVVGMAMYFTTFAVNDVLQIREGATVHLTVGITAAGLLTVKRGATILATSSGPALSLNSWYYLEFKGTIDDVTGTYAVRVNTVADAALTATGVDTRNGGTTGQWNTIWLGPCDVYVDDVYVLDQSGSAPRNSFLGPVKVITLYPQTDAVSAGNNQGLTPSTGTDHGALVDENPPNTTDYNSSPTIGAKDTYQYPPLGMTGTIYGIQTNLYVQKADALPRTVCAVVRHGGADYDGANVSPLTTFNYFSEVRQQTPGGSPAEWTPTDIDAIQVGMKVTA